MSTRSAALTIATIAALAGCAGAHDSTAGIPAAQPINTHARNVPGSSLPAAKSDNLLYVADYGTGVIVYSYRPGRIKYVGYLSGAPTPRGECVDANQDVFVTNGSYSILKYPHGQTSPTEILSDPVATPVACAVDPTTGNLAVAGYSRPDGQVVLYKNGLPGHRTIADDPGFGAIYACAYDGKGDLFIVGNVVSGTLLAAELPHGSTTFQALNLDQTFQGPYGAGVQWAGHDLVVGDNNADVAYRFSLSGSSGTQVGTTPLNGAADIQQFSIYQGRIIVANQQQEAAGFVKIYGYPAGGNANRTLRNFSSPWDAVVSLGS